MERPTQTEKAENKPEKATQNKQRRKTSRNENYY